MLSARVHVPHVCLPELRRPGRENADELVRETFVKALERFREVKQKYDSENFFRFKAKIQ
jgi:Berberine and berberine like